MAGLAKKLRALGNKLSGMLPRKDAYELPEWSAVRKSAEASKFVGKSSRASISADMVYGFAKWSSLGAPTFSLGEKASAAFMMTDVSNVSMRDVELPFESFLLLLPNSDFRITCPSLSPEEEALDNRINGVIISRGRPCTPRLVAHSVNSIEKDFNPDHAMDKFDELVYNKWAKPNELNDKSWGNMCDDLEVYEQTQFYSRECITISAFAYDQSKGRTICIQCIFDPNIGDTIEDCFINNTTVDTTTNMMAIARIAINLCLYLDNSGSSSGKTYDRSRLSDYITKRTDNACVWEVASEISIDKKIIEEAKERVQSGRDPANWKLQSKQVVRGHWKLQHHGQGRSLRKRIFIQPYVRGEDFEKQRSVIYVAK